ncbi:DNA-binding response regulator [Brevibacillus laterosporus]|uniref:Transcriptional regulatory protein YycF n=1 Tax=Brevibacillus laterosporus LMG 15441 TaxID=1042163 RepID=A0A075R0G7_BRELA|nr:MULTISPECIES: response regulator transcription factor [Brevibacillus]HAS00345.1 DNA-binding response regulator [Brevibacillus sp.]AIG24693.1 transcriptional regulatory protein YycF [Brevibacillus laterosporus LMG 15441]AUM63345.1 DNA-binding response regulator [Brevibacillus laterosporus]ERM18028.1 transcriptional regulator [Brevibacillus laterosporus PE36]MCR8964902.1 response regulator transcription factor [Brevibacillus laterosporus]
MGQHKILVVDDEENILQVIRAYLERSGYIVYVAETGEAALQLHQLLQPDLIILDLMLPDMSGEDICRKLRKTSDIPILMLTAKSAEDDKINGLLMGADDYVSKPFSPRELVARVITLLRRTGTTKKQEQALTFLQKRLCVEPELHQVTLDQASITLTPIEFKLLYTLASQPKKVFSRLELINHIQGYGFDGYERTIDVHIKNVRQKLNDDPKHPSFISTVFGVGYKFLVNRDEA